MPSASKRHGSDETPEDAQRRALQSKRAKLFHVMRECSMGDVLPEVHECNYPEFYQFALSMERMVQTHLRTRLAAIGTAEAARAAARAALSAPEDDSTFLKQVLDVVDYDMAGTRGCAARETLAPILEEPAVDCMVLEEEEGGPRERLPAYKLRILAPYTRKNVLAEVGWDFVDPSRVVQRDCVYQSLVYLHGMMSKHPFFQKASTPEEALALLAQKRTLALAALQAGVQRTFEEERSVLRTELEAARKEMADLKDDTALQGHLENALAAETKTEAQVVSAMAEMESARVDATTRFTEEDTEGGVHGQWLHLCGLRQQFWATELSKARARLLERRCDVEALRARMDSREERLKALENRLWATATSPYRKEGDIMVSDHVLVVEQAMKGVDAYLDAFRPLAGWHVDLARRMALLQAWMQHPDVLLDAHITVAERTHAMLGGAPMVSG